MITQKTINEVMNTAKVEEVVSDFINLKRRGVNMIGNCPFHDEKHHHLQYHLQRISINVLVVAKAAIL